MSNKTLLITTFLILYITIIIAQTCDLNKVCTQDSDCGSGCICEYDDLDGDYFCAEPL